MTPIPLSQLPFLSAFVWVAPGDTDGVPSSNPPKINLGNAEGSTVNNLYRVAGGAAYENRTVYGDPMVVPIPPR